MTLYRTVNNVMVSGVVNMLNIEITQIIDIRDEFQIPYQATNLCFLAPAGSGCHNPSP